MEWWCCLWSTSVDRLLRPGPSSGNANWSGVSDRNWRESWWQSGVMGRTQAVTYFSSPEREELLLRSWCENQTSMGLCPRDASFPTLLFLRHRYLPDIIECLHSDSHHAHEHTRKVTWSLLRATKKGARMYIQTLKHNYRYLKYFLQWKSSKFCFFTISIVIAEKKEATTWTSSIKSRLSAFLPWLQVLFQIQVSEGGRAEGPLIKQRSVVPIFWNQVGKGDEQKHITLP